MRALQGVVRRVALVWVLAQAVTLTLVPAALWTAAPAPILCTCVHKTTTACPMHHEEPAPHRLCVLRGTNSHSSTLVASLIGVAAPAGAPDVSIMPPPASDVFSRLVPSAFDRIVSPDPHPPRG